MGEIDAWQMMGSVAALSFTVGFLDQLRLTYTTRNVDGLSLFQWFVFTSASAMFTAYYVHLDQWLMVGVSILGTLCCLAIVAMIMRFRES